MQTHKHTDISVAHSALLASTNEQQELKSKQQKLKPLATSASKDKRVRQKSDGVSKNDSSSNFDFVGIAG